MNAKGSVGESRVENEKAAVTPVRAQLKTRAGSSFVADAISSIPVTEAPRSRIQHHIIYKTRRPTEITRIVLSILSILHFVSSLHASIPIRLSQLPQSQSWYEVITSEVKETKTAFTHFLRMQLD